MNRIARGRHTPLTPPSPPAEGGVGRGKSDIDPDFARLMAPLGPFEARPQLAVAVSGGADSLALALLAERWARARGGRIVALTVDHGLRRESAGEAAAVARWMKRRGIAHRILVWRGAKPGAGIQAAARAARYRLLEDWCAARARARGIVHLLLGHQREDQAETLLLRLERGSAAYGLAAMPAITERPGVRLLRPLLAVPRAALADFLRREGQAWIDDPSNRDRRYRRVHMRAALGGDSALSKRIADSAAELGRTRAALEAGVADCLVRAVTLHPEAFASLDGSGARRRRPRNRRTRPGRAPGHDRRRRLRAAPRQPAAALSRSDAAAGSAPAARSRAAASCRSAAAATVSSSAANSAALPPRRCAAPCRSCGTGAMSLQAVRGAGCFSLRSARRVGPRLPPARPGCGAAPCPPRRAWPCPPCSTGRACIAYRP